MPTVPDFRRFKIIRRRNVGAAEREISSFFSRERRPRGDKVFLFGKIKKFKRDGQKSSKNIKNRVLKFDNNPIIINEGSIFSESTKFSSAVVFLVFATSRRRATERFMESEYVQSKILPSVARIGVERGVGSRLVDGRARVGRFRLRSRRESRYNH